MPRLKNAAIAVLLLFAAAGTAAADETRSITVHGITRDYTLHLPQGAGNGRLPLLMVFRSVDDGASNIAERLTRINDLADRNGFAVIYPGALNQHWNDGRLEERGGADDIGFVRALLSNVAKAMALDGARIYAAGISNGGMFAQRLACQMPGVFAGIASVAATMPSNLAPVCVPKLPARILLIEGPDNPVMPDDGGAITVRTESGPVLSAPETAAFWAAREGCAITPMPAPANLPRGDRSRINATLYPACMDGGAVELDSVSASGGHAWPDASHYLPRFLVGEASDTTDASPTIVRFFGLGKQQG